tara:strand:- start:1036 stop:3039 length:2004 start_codon:yes stop_codon:yes gene_type:complete
MTETDILLKKLEPLIPEKVKKWRRTLDLANPELRELVHRQVLWTAHSILGDFRNKLLLSLPPAKIANGSFKLGTIQYEQEKWPFGISESELLQHVAIFGRSGAGKTNLAFLLLQQLTQKNINFLFLDWKRTARHLIPALGKKLKVYTPGRALSPFPFNPFIVPPGIEWKVYLNHLIDVLGDSHVLGDGAKSILQKTLAPFYGQNKTPTVSKALTTLENLDTKGRATGWKTSAVRALESLEFTQTETTRRKQEAFAKSLIRQNTILELDTLPQNIKKFLIPLICFWLYSVQLAGHNREELKLVIFLEEAHHTMYRSDNRSKESMMNVLFRQCRELGISFILIDQHPRLISSAALGNSFCKIFLNLIDPSDINKAAGMAMIGEKDKEWFSFLSIGQGIIKLQDRWHRPFLVKFPLVPIDKGKMTDEVLKLFLEDKLTLSQLRNRVNFKPFHTESFRKRETQHSVGESRVRLADTSDNSLRLLHDIFQHPEDGVRDRYSRLQISVDKGNKWKQELIHKGYVIPERVKVGRVYRVLLHPTDAARKLVTPTKGSRDGQAGFEHEYYKQLNADKLKQAGFKTIMEVPRRKSPGRMDLIAFGLPQPDICIEIETGKSDVVSNLKRDLAEGYKKIIVVVTDSKALERVKQKLDKAGLFITPRVVVVLKDEFRNTT